jgi:hypothetical protein
LLTPRSLAYFSQPAILLLLFLFLFNAKLLLEGAALGAIYVHSLAAKAAEKARK